MSRPSNQKINSIHIGTTLNINVEQYDLNDLVHIKYAQITSVDLNSSFSMHKNILVPNRMISNENNLTKNIFVNLFFIILFYLKMCNLNLFFF